MNTHDKIIYVGCRNTYEEIKRLYDGDIGWLSADASVAMRSAVRKAGITPQKNGRKLKFYGVNAAKAEHLNADGRTVVAAMSDMFYDR